MMVEDVNTDCMLPSQRKSYKLHVTVTSRVQRRVELELEPFCAWSLTQRIVPLLKLVRDYPPTYTN